LEKDVEDLSAFFKYATWEDVPLMKKIKLINGWRVWNTIGSFLQIFSSLIVAITYLADSDAQDIYVSRVLLGFSVFMTWVQLFEYLEFWDGLTLITTTFQKASADVKVYGSLAIIIIIGCGVLSNTFIILK
jgi:Polycystin cation channel.